LVQKEKRLSMTSEMHESFTRIYQTNGWNNQESRSGPTSTLHWTTNLRKALPRLLHKFGIKTLFDAPCGDMNWMRELLKELTVDYIGGDIVEPMIEQHKSDPDLQKRAKFMLLDLTRDRLPSADLMLARDFLIHLSFEDTLAFMRNFAASDIRYLLTTSHINKGKFENRDIRTGSWRWIDLFQAPYNFPDDTLDQIFDGKNDRYLYLWTRAQIADACEMFGYPQNRQVKNTAQQHALATQDSATEAVDKGAANTQGDPSESASGLGPEDLRSIIARGSSSISSRDFTTAISHADQVIEAVPHHRQAIAIKAEALVGQRRHAEALRLLRSALEVHGSDAKLLNLTRNVAFEHAGIHEAGEYALRLAEISPGELKNELFVIDWNLASGQTATALRRADAVLKENPDAPQAYFRKVQALLAENRANEALETVREALLRQPENPKLLTLGREVALGRDCIDEANDYALRLLTIAPEDDKNLRFVIQTRLASGEFDAALRHADALLHRRPDDLRGLMLKAQALVALHQVRDALAILQELVARHPNDIRLLRLTRSIGFQNGRFATATDCAARLCELQPEDPRNPAFLLQCYMADQRFDLIDRFVGPDGVAQKGLLRKEYQYYDDLKSLTKTAPAFASAWKLSLANGIDRAVAGGAENRPLNATMIQYWSQGAPPRDVEIVIETWTKLFETNRLGHVALYDREQAEAWIRANAPEFLGQFSKAFHYAMEADIFRIAYASKQPCLYMDIDSWPLEHTAAILRFALEAESTMLYLRAHRPVIANGFFVSRPDCPFVRELVDQCLAIDLDSLPKDYVVLEATFGPSRYSKVFTDLLASSASATASMVENVPGCSSVLLDGRRIYFAHEAAVASVRPPFPLGYKATEDYWKSLSLR
jgi:tetratricopeptide (TPR) repeat protein